MIPTGVRFVDDNGRPFQVISQEPAISDGRFITVALFATDAVTIGEHLTVNAGVRFDHGRAIIRICGASTRKVGKRETSSTALERSMADECAGRLPNDRPHMLRVMTTVEMPLDFSIAANFQQFTGKRWAATAQITLPQGDQRVLLESRGSRRLSSQSLLDVRLSKRLQVGGIGRIELLVDILNALSDTAEEELATDNLFSPNFAQPTVFMDPVERWSA
jgi:hypothetical protein